MPETASAKKGRRGSETRQRTDQVTLRLLPDEGAALSSLAKQHGHASRQSFIRAALQPLIATSRQTSSLPAGSKLDGTDHARSSSK